MPINFRDTIISERKFMSGNKLLRSCLTVTPWPVAHQAPLSLGFYSQEYWSELSFPSPKDLPDSRFRQASFRSPKLASWFFNTSTIWEAPKFLPRAHLIRLLHFRIFFSYMHLCWYKVPKIALSPWPRKSVKRQPWLWWYHPHLCLHFGSRGNNSFPNNPKH